MPDFCDNCTAAANADQRDTNRDGFGNVCDADLDGNGIVDDADKKAMSGLVGQSGDGLDADLDGNRLVDKKDIKLLKKQFGKPPGPSAADR